MYIHYFMILFAWQAVLLVNKIILILIYRVLRSEWTYLRNKNAVFIDRLSWIQQWLFEHSSKQVWLGNLAFFSYFCWKSSFCSKICKKIFFSMNFSVIVHECTLSGVTICDQNGMLNSAQDHVCYTDWNTFQASEIYIKLNKLMVWEPIYLGIWCKYHRGAHAYCVKYWKKLLYSSEIAANSSRRDWFCRYIQPLP